MDDEGRRADATRLCELRLSAAYARGRASTAGLPEPQRLLAISLGQLFEAEADELQAELDVFPPL